MVTILAILVRMLGFLLAQRDPQGTQDKPASADGQNTQTSVEKAGKLKHGYS